MNANEIAFGVELETTMPNRDTTPVGGRHRGINVTWLPGLADGEPWRAEVDGSIQAQNPNRHGVEFVSPILMGAAGLSNLVNSMKSIKTRGGQVNHTCGMHVTVSWNGDARALARLLTLVANHEKAIYASTGTARREQGRWCKPVKAYGNVAAAQRHAQYDRYHVINLEHLARGANRIEFRAFAGTLNPLKAAAAVQMILGLVALACSMKRLPTWTYTKEAGTESAWDRAAAGDGETEVNRLFYRLGWTKGHTKVCYGQLGSDADIRKCKEMIREMAKRYDRESR